MDIANKVAIQGIKAAFHDVAARKYFGDKPIELDECATFRRVATKVKSGEANFGIMAIENTIAGSLLPNYNLIEEFGLRVSGEVYLRIEMNLMALPGTKLEEIKNVMSHPMALHQCEEFTDPHNWELHEAKDTAWSAMEIQEKKLKGFAALGSSLAAETYGLEILAQNVETNKENYTRFLVVENKHKLGQNGSNKTSLRFSLSHETGCLATALTSFSNHSINLSKIQSVPVLGKPYQYAFHADLEWGNRNQYLQAIDELSNNTITMRIIGEYKKGLMP